MKEDIEGSQNHSPSMGRQRKGIIKKPNKLLTHPVESSTKMYEKSGVKLSIIG